MKVLFLGHADSPLIAYLSSVGEEVVTTDEKITPALVKKQRPDFIVSYRYRHILRPDVLNTLSGRIINLHTSYLPYNRGAEPHFWCLVEGTPCGVTIHDIDAGIDTGDIITQRRIEALPDDTLKTFYDRLHVGLQALFREHWKDIKNGAVPRRKQDTEGTYHAMKDIEQFSFLLDEGGAKGATSVKTLQEYHKQHAGQTPQSEWLLDT